MKKKRWNIVPRRGRFARAIIIPEMFLFSLIPIIILVWYKIQKFVFPAAVLFFNRCASLHRVPTACRTSGSNVKLINSIQSMVVNN
jgi:hypothetical protein